MPILYDPPLGAVVLCDYATGFRPPEMVKVRPVLVVSPRLHSRSGLCTVVPLSTTAPARPVPYACEIDLPFALPGKFKATKVWAKADMLATVALARLDLFRTGRDPRTGKRSYLRVRVDPAELAKVQACLRVALGL